MRYVSLPQKLEIPGDRAEMIVEYRAAGIECVEPVGNEIIVRKIPATRTHDWNVEECRNGLRERRTAGTRHRGNQNRRNQALFCQFLVPAKLERLRAVLGEHLIAAR